MKTQLFFSLTLLAAGSLLAADASLKDDVTSAAAALGNQPNYSWRTTVEVGNNSRFRPGPTEGKTEKDSYTTYSMTFNDNATVTNPKGTVTFWIADGKLLKIQTHVSGTVSFNGNDRDVDRTTTTVIRAVGTTKIEIPDEAKKKLE